MCGYSVVLSGLSLEYHFPTLPEELFLKLHCVISRERLLAALMLDQRYCVCFCHLEILG